MHVPPDVPAAAFWSLTLYDTATRSMVQNPRNDAARSSYDKLKANADGSVDLSSGQSAGRVREQLDRNGAGQRLLPDGPLLLPKAGRVRRLMEAAGRRVDEVRFAKSLSRRLIRRRVVRTSAAGRRTARGDRSRHKTPVVSTAKYAAKVPASVTTPDTVQTRIGTLNFNDGLPDADTVKKVYDNLDFVRGVEAFLLGMPAAIGPGPCDGALSKAASRRTRASASPRAWRTPARSS